MMRSKEIRYFMCIAFCMFYKYFYYKVLSSLKHLDQSDGHCKLDFIVFKKKRILSIGLLVRYHLFCKTKSKYIIKNV